MDGWEESGWLGGGDGEVNDYITKFSIMMIIKRFNYTASVGVSVVASISCGIHRYD